MRWRTTSWLSKMGITLSIDFLPRKCGVSHIEVHLPQWLVAKDQEEIRRIKMNMN